jgi:hypothetical protein
MKKISWLFLIALILLACAPQNDSASRCLSPAVQKAYFPHEKGVDPYMMPKQPMPSWWETQLDDKKDYSQFPPFFKPTDIVIRNGNELWFSGLEAVFLYKIDSGELRKYSMSRDRGYRFMVSDLLVGIDGTLWVYLDMAVENSKRASPPDLAVLGRFNPERDSFEFVHDNNGLIQQKDLLGTKWYPLKARHLLRETRGGKLVLIVNGHLVLFEPKTGDATRLADSLSTVSSIDLDAKDNIWFAVNEDDVLRKFDMEDSQITEYGVAPGLVPGAYYNAITVDKSGLVWVGNYGWLDPDNPKGFRNHLWTEIIPAAVYIKKPGADYLYQWTGPSDSIQASDGSMWFIGGVGIVRFSVESGEWCWKAPYSAPIAEDGDGSLWMVIGNQIYKYQLP